LIEEIEGEKGQDLPEKMTLPSRPGYNVPDRARTTTSTNASSTPSPSDFQKNVQYSQSNTPSSHHGTPLNDPHLFPFLAGHGDFMHMDRISFLPESGDVSVHPENHGQMPMSSPTPNPTYFASRLTDLFKPTPQDSLAPEEVLERKTYVRSHRLLPAFLAMLTTCKKENILPEPQINLDTPHPFEDFGLDDFLESQGIDTTPMTSSEDSIRNAQREEFLYKLEQLRFKYKEEIEKLNKVCNECCSQLIFVLRDQSSLRPVGEHEAQAKLQKIKHKFDYVKNQLRVCVCSAISALQKQYNQVRKKHKSLPKKATSSLSQWFFEHIQNPYPTEQEKAILAATGGLTLTQVNNWFGNKRIRYKRKCLENEAKKLNEDGEEVQPTSPQSGSASGNAPVAPSPGNSRGSNRKQVRSSKKHKDIPLEEEDDEDDEE